MIGAAGWEIGTVRSSYCLKQHTVVARRSQQVFYDPRPPKSETFSGGSAANRSS